MYPLTAVHLPGVNYTLNNVEPRNLQMALDLSSTTTNNHLFCVVLRAMDTGRIARVGTLMQVLDTEPQYGPEEQLIRVIVTCTALQAVKVETIPNGQQAEDPVEKLKKSRVYLKATVSAMECENDDKCQRGNDSDLTATKQLIQDLSLIHI